MDFSIPEDLKRMRATIRDFVETDLVPISQKVEEQGYIREDAFQKMQELGLFWLAIPKEYGGLGFGTLGECLVYAAWLRDKKGTSVIKEASMAKLFCTEMAYRIVDLAMQIHGWTGYMKECPVERFNRDLRLIRIYEGTSEIQRLIIARELLRS